MFKIFFQVDLIIAFVIINLFIYAKLILLKYNKEHKELNSSKIDKIKFIECDDITYEESYVIDECTKYNKKSKYY